MKKLKQKFSIRLFTVVMGLVWSTFAQDVPEQWKEVSFDHSSWADVQEIGVLNTAPWGGLLENHANANKVSNARWIWGPDGNPTSNVPAGDWYFRRSFTIPAGKTVQSAELAMTADNIYTAYLNETLIAMDSTWEEITTSNISPNNFSSQNVLAVEGVNTLPGASGFIGTLLINFSDGSSMEVNTGTGWKVFKIIPPPTAVCDPANLTGIRGPVPYQPRLLTPPAHDLPGDPLPLPVHKGVNLDIWHQPGDNFHVGGMGLLDNGDMLQVDYNGKLYHVTGLDNGNTVTRRELNAQPFVQALGLVVRNNREVYVLDQSSIWSYDFDGTNLTNENKVLDVPRRGGWYGWNCDLAMDDTYLYAGLGTRGGFSRYHFQNKTWEHDYAYAMRNSNGMGMNESGDIWFTDNQGNYRPATPLFLMKEGKQYGVPINDWKDGAAKWQGVLGPDPDLTPYQSDMIWFPYPYVSYSGTDVHFMRSGPFKGQALVGDNRTGHLNRMIVEEVNGQKQGTVIRMTGGLEAGTYRIVETPDGSYYLGGLGTLGDGYWVWCGKQFGFQKMSFKSDFIGNPNYNDVLKVSLVNNGVVVEFTSDISDDYLDFDNYRTYTFNYIKAVTPYYGGAKKDSVEVNIREINKLSNRQIHINVEGLVKESILALEFGDKLTQDNNLESTELFYTMNHLSQRTSSDVVSLEFNSNFFHEISLNQKDGKLYIHGLKGRTTDHVIYDITGRKVTTLSFKNLDQYGSVDISSLTDGVYFLKMKINNESFSRTFVIQ